MEIIVPQEVHRSPRLFAAADRMRKLLEIESRDPITDDPVTAEFGIFHDPTGRAGLDLSLADPTGTASKRFPVDSLSDPDYLSREVRYLWGDLLRVRSLAYLARLREHIAALPVGE